MKSQRLFVAKQIALLLAFLFGWMASSAHAITAEQARDLPEQELAQLVLGNAGKLFVEVRRPDWQDGAGFLIANRPIEGKAPPLRWLYFYAHPENVNSNERVEGLCKAQRAKITFSDSGEVTGVEFDDVYGFASKVSFGAPYPNPSHSKELQESCAAVSALRFFETWLPRGDEVDAVFAVHQVHEAMAQGGAQWLDLSCSAFGPSQSCTAMHYASQVDIDGITILSSCSRGWQRPKRSNPTDRCLNVGLGGIPCMTMKGLTIILSDDRDRVEIRSASFYDSRIVC